MKYDASISKPNGGFVINCKYCDFSYKVDSFRADNDNTSKMKDHYNDKHWYIKKHSYPQKEVPIRKDKIKILSLVKPKYESNKVAFYGNSIYSSERELSMREQENVERIEVDGEYIWRWTKHPKVTGEKVILVNKNLGGQKLLEYLSDLFQKYPKMIECRIVDNIHGNFVLSYVMLPSGDDTVDWTI